jgi:hypothetical protein
LHPFEMASQRLEEKFICRRHPRLGFLSHHEPPELSHLLLIGIQRCRT